MKTIYQQRYQALIENFINQRKKANLTQAEVAYLLGKPQSYIAKIEGKDRRLDILEYIELCEVLNIQPSVLMQYLESL